MKWRALVEQAVSPLLIEQIEVVNAARRVSAAPFFSPVSLPSFAESLRDGFLIYQNDLFLAQSVGLSVTSETPAGCKDISELASGEAFRIFTGGVVNRAADKCIVPQEFCHEKGGRVYVVDYVPEKRYIRKAGAEIARGEQIIDGRQPLSLNDAAKLVQVGCEQLAVYKKPKVTLCCTGNELVRGNPVPGEKISINDFLMRETLRSEGITEIESTLVKDSESAFTGFLEKAVQKSDLIITSGGMGPGKYDFSRRVIGKLDAEILLDTLPMRPGKILLARLSKSLLLSLPGPPKAVQTLLYELVLPVVRLLQGSNTPWNKSISAELLVASEKVFREDHIKSGCLEYAGGRVAVRPAGRFEQADCHIIYRAGEFFPQGRQIEVHLWHLGQ